MNNTEILYNEGFKEISKYIPDGEIILIYKKDFFFSNVINIIFYLNNEYFIAEFEKDNFNRFNDDSYKKNYILNIVEKFEFLEDLLYKKNHFFVKNTLEKIYNEKHYNKLKFLVSL